MTEQSQNTVFHSSSFLQGQNAEWVEHLHARYARDPSSVDSSWAAFFRGLDDPATDVQRNAGGQSARAQLGPSAFRCTSVAGSSRPRKKAAQLESTLDGSRA